MTDFNKDMLERLYEENNTELLLKNLRIGIIQNDKLIDEFIIESKDVTIGSNLKNNIIILNKKEKRYKLFKYVDNGKFKLNLTKDMKLILNSKKIKEKKIIIDSKDKGKIEINDIKILFQFIEREKIIIPKMLPKEFKNKFSDYIDWKFITPLLLSFIIHTLWVGWMQTLDLDAQVINLETIPEIYVNMITEGEKKPKIIKKIEENNNSKKITKKITRKKIVLSNKNLSSEKKKIRRVTIGRSKILSAINTLGVMRNSNTLLGSNNDSEMSLASLDNNLTQNYQNGGQRGEMGTSIRGNSLGAVGVYRTKTLNNNKLEKLDGIKSDRKDIVLKNSNKRVAIKVNKVKSKFKIKTKLNKSSARKAIKKSQKRVNWCYQEGTKKNHNFKGRITIVIMIGLNGKPLNIDIINRIMNDEELEKRLSKCIMRKLKRVSFPIPETVTQIKFNATFSSN